MCTWLDTKKNLVVGNGKSAIYASSQCTEKKLTTAGECISEVTFYRHDKTYLSGYRVDYGIVGMSFKTNIGKYYQLGPYSLTYTSA